jgi:hypothetical protein
LIDGGSARNEGGAHRVDDLDRVGARLLLHGQHDAARVVVPVATLSFCTLSNTRPSCWSRTGALFRYATIIGVSLGVHELTGGLHRGGLSRPYSVPAGRLCWHRQRLPTSVRRSRGGELIGIELDAHRDFDPQTCTCATPLIVGMRCASWFSA